MPISVIIGKRAGVAIKIRRLVYALVALLLVSLFVASVEARGGNLVISPSGEAIEKIQLAPPDNVVGNMSVSDGFVDFFVTNPSYDIVYRSLKTSFDSFNFTANESGIYVMHFVNKYQSGDVNVTLYYGCNFFFVTSVNIGISTFSTQTTTLGDATITRVQPYLHLDVSPLAFPVVGQFWELFVYYQTNSSDGIAHYSPLPNATVEVTVRVGNQTKVYSITSDEVGHAEFQFLAEYSDISFQAVSGGNRSDIFALTQRAEHYVSADFVDFMFALSGVMSGITAASVIALHFRKRIRVIFSLLIGVVFCLSMVQLVISVYSKSFLWTPWGYSESIFSFLTWTTLKYASLVGIVLFAVLCLLALWLKLRSPKLGVPLK
jgi:hypothetical protein